MSYVTITKGTFRGIDVSGMSFELVKDFQVGTKGGFVTVKSNDELPGEYENKNIRVKVAKKEFIVPTVVNMLDSMHTTVVSTTEVPETKAKGEETDEQII